MYIKLNCSFGSLWRGCSFDFILSYLRLNFHSMHEAQKQRNAGKNILNWIKRKFQRTDLAHIRFVFNTCSFNSNLCVLFWNGFLEQLLRSQASFLSFNVRFTIPSKQDKLFHIISFFFSFEINFVWIQRLNKYVITFYGLIANTVTF